MQPAAAPVGGASATTGALPTANQPAQPAAANAASASLTQPVGPNGLSPAQQTGKRVGDTVAKLAEKEPVLGTEIDKVMDLVEKKAASGEDLMPKLQEFQATIQPYVKRVPQRLVVKLSRLFDDPESQQMVIQLFERLRKEPDPEVLAALKAEKAEAANKADKMESSRPNRSHRPSRPSDMEDEGYLADDDELSSSEKPTLRERLRNVYGKLKEHIPFRDKSGDKLPSHSKPGRYSNEEDFDDEDLAPRPSQSRRNSSPYRHPALDDEEY
jgi:hypothetical protein